MKEKKEEKKKLEKRCWIYYYQLENKCVYSRIGEIFDFLLLFFLHFVWHFMCRNALLTLTQANKLVQLNGSRLFRLYSMKLCMFCFTFMTDVIIFRRTQNFIEFICELLKVLNYVLEGGLGRTARDVFSRKYDFYNWILQPTDMIDHIWVKLSISIVFFDFVIVLIHDTWNTESTFFDRSLPKTHQQNRSKLRKIESQKSSIVSSCKLQISCNRNKRVSTWN